MTTNSARIDQLLRQMAADGNDAIPEEVYRENDAHWAAHYATRPYVEAGADYEDYAPAYLYGVYRFHANPEQHFDASEQDLASGWNAARGDSPLDWARAKPAVREAWYLVSDLDKRARLERAAALSASPSARTPGDH